jgi:hypothetical protein
MVCETDTDDLLLEEKLSFVQECEFIDLHVPPVSLSKSNCICKCYFDSVDLEKQMKGIGYSDLSPPLHHKFLMPCVILYLIHYLAH